MDVFGEQQTLYLPAGTLTYFICQTPVTAQMSDHDEIEVHYADETSLKLPQLWLDEEASQHIFWRDGEIERLTVTFGRGSQI